MACARFRILRFLAQGGMGEVYEAEDLELGGRVALKTILPEIAGDPRVMRRFKREVTLARKVTHPNVCRIFDVFHHASSDGPGGSTTFLTMEMLPGETLAARLRRMGPLATNEALPLIEQMAAGLHAAHQAGIVHRDLKPANVILVANGHGERAVLTDFGLARSQEDTGPASSSAGAEMVGTSAYMSPEQVEGREVTAASDIYSLGVVVYEMVTGVKPFLSDTALATAVQRLKEAPASPRVHRPDLDPRWERAILHCLEVSPAGRFQDVDEVVAALGRGRSGRPRANWNRTPSGYAIAAAVAVATAGAAFVTSVHWRRAQSAASAATTPAARRSVALLGFKNLSGRDESAWLSTALSEMLGMELAAGEALRVIPGENVARMKAELALSDADSLAPDTLARIRANLGTDLVVLGSYLAQGEKAGERLRLDLRVQDTAAGALVASITETGTEADLLDFVSRGGNRLRQELGIGGSAGATSASFPSNPQAARLYAEGLARLRAFDALAARDLLQGAVAADASFPLSHSALAEAWWALGYDGEAQRESKAALDLSARLTREERLAVEGRHYAISSQWPKAVESYHLLWGFFPDNAEYGLRLAAAQSAAGRGQDALATVDALRKSSGRDDPRVDLAEAEAAAALSQFQRCRTAAARAAQAGEEREAPLLAAEARLQQAEALYALGETAASIAAYEEARRAYERTGDRRGVAAAILGMGITELRQPRVAEAEKLFQQSLAINREIGHQKGVSHSLRRLGNVLSLRGDHAAAGAIYEQTLATDRQRGDRAGIFNNLRNLALTFHHRGDLATAARFEAEALAIARDLHDIGKVTAQLQMIGWTRFDLGEISAALDVFEEALALNRQAGLRGATHQNLYGIGGIRRLRGDLEGARQVQEEGLRVRLAFGADGPAMQSRVELAGILLDEGRAAEAERVVRDPVAHFQAASDRVSELLARVVQVRCLLAQAKLAEAQASSQRVADLARTSETRAARLSAATVIAVVDAASGRAEAALRSLERTVAEARKLRFAVLEFEARLALGEMEVKHGRAAAGRARLAELEKQARAKQFILIARKAARQLQAASAQ